MKKFVHLENSRTAEQDKVMRQIKEDKLCPFCRENLAKYHKNPILIKGKHWVITKNQWPYEGAKYHVLAIANRHIESIEEVRATEIAELFSLFKKTQKKLRIKGGALAMRFGKIARPASTVAHLHVHLIEPDSAKKDHKGVKFPMSKSAQK